MSDPGELKIESAEFSAMIEILLFRQMTLTIATYLIEEAQKKAEQIGVDMVITIADSGGNVVALHRMDQALLGSVNVSMAKAYTAVAFKSSTADLSDAASPGGELHGLEHTDPGKICTFGGGIPLYIGRRIIGSVGVSGGSVAQDMAVAQAAADAFTEYAAHELSK